MVVQRLCWVANPSTSILMSNTRRSTPSSQLTSGRKRAPSKAQSPSNVSPSLQDDFAECMRQLNALFRPPVSTGEPPKKPRRPRPAR